jgi:hypothetical protein
MAHRTRALHIPIFLFCRGGSWRNSWLEHGCDHQRNPLFIHRRTHKILVHFDLEMEEARNIMTRVLSPSHPDVLAARRSPADSGLAALRQGPARRHPLSVTPSLSKGFS